MNNISANIDNIFLDINQIIEEYSVNKNITLIAVSKKKSVEAIKIAYESGQRDFGENYLQESVEKIKALKDLNINWHFIGSIQSNKVKHIVENFDWIHSVDSFKIAEKINKFCLQKKINMCIQVNLNDEESKSGIPIHAVKDFLRDCQSLENINIRGLMTIPRPEKNFNTQLEQFKIMKECFDQMNMNNFNLDTLSMGMSNDYKAAIAAGSNMIRVGTKIFGERI